MTFFVLKEEKVTVKRVVGVIVGLIGVLLIARPWKNGDTALDVKGVIYMLIGSLSVGASLYMQKIFNKNQYFSRSFNELPGGHCNHYTWSLWGFTKYREYSIRLSCVDWCISGTRSSRNRASLHSLLCSRQ